MGTRYWASCCSPLLWNLDGVYIPETDVADKFRGLVLHGSRSATQRLLSESQLAPQDARTHQSLTDILLTTMRQCLVVALLLRACSSMRTPQAAVSRRSIGGLAAAGVALRPSLPVPGQRRMRAFELRAVFVDARRVASSTA